MLVTTLPHGPNCPHPHCHYYPPGSNEAEYWPDMNAFHQYLNDFLVLYEWCTPTKDENVLKWQDPYFPCLKGTIVLEKSDTLVFPHSVG